MRDTDSSKCSVTSLTEPRLINKLYELILKEKELGKHGWLRNVYKNKNFPQKSLKIFGQSGGRGHYHPVQRLT